MVDGFFAANMKRKDYYMEKRLAIHRVMEGIEYVSMNSCFV